MLMTNVQSILCACILTPTKQLTGAYISLYVIFLFQI